jgi:hypothetical protein
MNANAAMVAVSPKPGNTANAEFTDARWDEREETGSRMGSSEKLPIFYIPAFDKNN